MCPLSRFQCAIPTRRETPLGWIEAATSWLGTGLGALLPVADQPEPGQAHQALARLLAGTGAAIDCLHAGTQPPRVTDAAQASVAVRCVAGDPVAAILAEAADADLIAMPTAGRQGFRDALRGSTTERVIAQARCPVLALPVG